MAFRTGFTPSACMLIVGAALLWAGHPVAGQESDDAARALDRIDRRTGAIERNIAPSPDRAERIGIRQSLRDAERRSRRFSGDRRGFDRAEIREIERRLDRLDRAERQSAPAIGGRGRPGPRGSTLITPAIPEIDLDLDALTGAED